MDENQVKKCTIFECLAGSHSYGTSTPESDVDVRGVCIPEDPSYYVGMGINRFEQKDKGWSDGDDKVIYDFRKALNLMADANPNMLDMLFTDSQHHRICEPVWELVLDKRDHFLSKKVRYTYGGYAFAQLKRIKRHRNYLLNPPKEKPERAKFGLPERKLISSEQAGAYQWLVAKIMKDSIEVMKISPEAREELYGINYIGAVQSGIPDECAQTLKELTGATDEWVTAIMAEKRYENALKDYNAYQSWRKTRNKKRQHIEDKYGYDCYLNDTEFLTESGWKLYDEIDEDTKLATIDKVGHVVYQNYFDRVKKEYSGEIIHFETQDSLCSVTPNHRMLVSKVRRSKKNNFSTKYDIENANWEIKSAESLLKDKHSYYHIRTGPISTGFKDYEISDEILILVGAYASEGCVGKRLKDGTPSVLRFSQKQGGRLCEWVDKIPQGTLRKYEYQRKDKLIVELIYTLADKGLASKIVEWCGEKSENKRLPPWISKLNSRQAHILLETLISGDGTERFHSKIYYTKSKQLADDVHALVVMAGGKNAKVWGPYRDGMYHVYISDEPTFDCIVCNDNSPHVTKEIVESQEIVCFSVPNEILITRRQGKVAVQGNTKHAMHLVRLMRMGMEILEEGKVQVYRPDREELVAIRNGAWSYEQIEEYAEVCDKKMDELYKTSSLPKLPKRKEIDKLCQEVIAGWVFGV